MSKSVRSAVGQPRLVFENRVQKYTPTYPQRVGGPAGQKWASPPKPKNRKKKKDTKKWAGVSKAC